MKCLFDDLAADQRRLVAEGLIRSVGTSIGHNPGLFDEA